MGSTQTLVEIYNKSRSSFNQFLFPQERALYLSLKYEFVTPLTSLVVVKPDSKEKGNFGDADETSDSQKKINFMNSASHATSSLFTFISVIVLVIAAPFN